MSLTTFKNRKWQRQRNDNDAYLEDLNQIVDQVNALPGTNTVLGYYATLAALTTAHPVGTVGQFAIVGNTIYIWDPLTSTWITIGDTLYKGVLDASTDIPYPAAQVGEFWFISVAGHIGSKQVEVGDQVICIEAYAGGMDDTKFMIVQTNIEVTAVSYSELALLLNNTLLIPGRHYLLHDFATAYNLFDGGTNTVVENAVGTPEALMLLATNSNEIAREAYSITHPEDIIYYHPYAKAADRAAFIVAGDVGYIDAGDVVPSFKGVIEFRHDTKQNVSTWYDFRNIKFRRWAVDAVAYDGGTAYVAKDVCKSSDGNIYKCILATIGGPDPSGDAAHWILWLDITPDSYLSWTSDATRFNVGDITTTNLIFVPATYQDVYTFGDWYQHVNNVTIGKNDLALVMGYGYHSTLNNIVFKTTDDIYTCYSSEIGETSYNNTIGSSFYYNTIGNSFNYNTIGNSFNYNTIGNNFSTNTIGDYFNSNTIGDYFNYNTISNGFNYNTIGNSFRTNTIGNYFNTNTIGNSFTYNTISNGFNTNTIGNYFYTNTIGNNFNTNTIGDNSKVSAGINCQGNFIGNYNNQVTLGDACKGITIGENNGTITLGANCQNLTFKNGCTFTNTNATALMNTTFENGSVVNGLDFVAATHIKNTTYNKTVFNNAAGVARLSYYDAADALTVDDVNS